MRRKTAPKDPVHPEVSRAVASEVGLIATGEEGVQSAVGECVLDNRSHRTTQRGGAGPARMPVVGESRTASYPLQPIVMPQRALIGTQQPSKSQIENPGSCLAATRPLLGLTSLWLVEDVRPSVLEHSNSLPSVGTVLNVRSMLGRGHPTAHHLLWC